MQNTDEVRKAGISLGLSHMLNCLGYSPQMINRRRRLNNNMNYFYTCISYHGYEPHLQRIVGSKAEGVSPCYESDVDFLFCLRNVLCIEASVQNYTGNFSKINTIYTMVPCLYHPGHFKLLLIREGLPSLSSGVTDRLRTCLNPSDSGHWLSSKEFLNWAKRAGGDGVDTTTGPAVCTLNRPGQPDQDNTLTLPCICPSILGNWIQRNRKYNWPPTEVIQQISQMSGNLVATGIKGCHEEEIEWRLCFNEIEILLVENWNETETKLYIFLKMIKKDILKLDHEITSYMMKNIVFWLSERYPQTDFRLDNLFSWAIKALRLFKRSVKKFHLPYYMIPERNLITEKLSKYRIKDTIKQINNAIKLGPQLFWKCEKIEMAMTMRLPGLQLYQQKRDEIELLEILQAQDNVLKCIYLGLTVNDWKKTDYVIAIQKRYAELMCSPWPPEVQQQLNNCSTTYDKVAWLLK